LFTEPGHKTVTKIGIWAYYPYSFLQGYGLFLYDETGTSAEYVVSDSLHTRYDIEGCYMDPLRYLELQVRFPYTLPTAQTDTSAVLRVDGLDIWYIPTMGEEPID